MAVSRVKKGGCPQHPCSSPGLTLRDLGILGRREIAPEDSQGRALGFNLAWRANPEAPQDRHRRAPSLKRVLQEESSYQQSETEELLACREAKGEREQDQGGGVCFKHAFDVPLVVKFLEPSVNRVPATAGSQGEIDQRLALDTAVDLVSGVLLDAPDRCGKFRDGCNHARCFLCR